MKRAAITLAAAVALAACGGPSLDRGEVEAKDYSPMYPMQMPMYDANGRLIGFTTTIIPASWSIKVCADVDLERACDWWEVGPGTFDATAIGDVVSREAAR